jgi:hypothetical protein
MGERPTRWRKRPVEIWAMRWDPSDPEATGAAIGWLNAGGVDFHATHGVGSSTALAIHTLEGNMIVSPGDWIIRGVQGEFYPCKPDIFAATYEEARADG